MNVMVVVPWDQMFGGVASVVGNLGRELERRGHSVIFVHPGTSNCVERQTTVRGFDGYRVLMRAPSASGAPLKSRVGFLLSLPVTLAQLGILIVRHRIQVVNIHYPIDLFVHFGLLRWLIRYRLVISVHGADLFPAGSSLPRYPWAVKLLFRRADRLVAPSMAFTKDVVALFPHVRHKATCIYNGIDFEEFDRRTGPAMPKHGGRYLLCVAALTEGKGIDILLRAFAEVLAQHHAIDLVLVGDGPRRLAYEELSVQLDLQDRARFMGALPRSDVARLLHGCEAFVLPTRSESFGLVVAEAMACRKAIVASAVGGIPEIVEDGVSALLVEKDSPEALARALMRVLEDHQLREALANAGYERVHGAFSSERTGTSYEALFEEVLRPAGAGKRG